MCVLWYGKLASIRGRTSLYLALVPDSLMPFFHFTDHDRSRSVQGGCTTIISNCWLDTASLDLLFLSWVVFFLWGLENRRYVLREGKDLGDQRHSNRAATVMGSSISPIAIGVHSVVDFNLYVPANGLLAVCLAGILVSHLIYDRIHWWRYPGSTALSSCFVSG